MSKIMIAFDVETTGKNAEIDQIIEISMCLYEAGSETSFHKLIKPDVEITRGAQRVHGISMDDVRDAPSFGDVADEIAAFLDSAEVIVGYNVQFDIRFVEAEFARIGKKYDFSSKLVVDPYRIWQVLEPRKLEDAHRKFVGGELENAHSATADVQAVVKVLRGIRREYNLEEAAWEDLARMTFPDRESWIGPTQHFQWDEEEVVFGFGKFGGHALLSVARTSPDYLRWIIKSDFPPHVRNLCKGALSGFKEKEFNERIVRVFGPPPLAESAD